MRALGIIVGLGCAALLCPPGARAEPITLALNGGTGGFSASPGSLLIDAVLARSGHDRARRRIQRVDLRRWPGTAPGLLGHVPGPGICGEPVHDRSPRSCSIRCRTASTRLTEPSHHSSPAGFSTSNNTDGLSFAWNSGLERSASFAGGGTATLHVDEDTNSHDLLAFHGFGPGAMAAVTFGVRDNLGSRGFLLRLSTDGEALSATPEPASLLLLATGLAGLARYGRRRPVA